MNHTSGSISFATHVTTKRAAAFAAASDAPASPRPRLDNCAADTLVAMPTFAPIASTWSPGDKPLGGTAELTVIRNGRETTLSVALRTAPEGERDEITIRARSPFQGVKIANLSPALADQLRLDTAAEGVAVVEVPDGSAAQQYGFQPGDIIVAVNGSKIQRTRDLDRVTRDGGRLWRVTIQRGGQQISAVFSG